ncbi:MAG: MBL fold metallo-hydrolase [Bacteroidota bacterium]
MKTKHLPALTMISTGIKSILNLKILLSLVSIVTLTSCVIFRPSAVWQTDDSSIQVKNCSISSTGNVFMNLFGLIKAEFMPASIKIEWEDQILFVDPLSVDDTVKADYIFITHNHLDHFSKEDIINLSKPGTVIVGPASVTKKLPDGNYLTASIGDTIIHDKISCEVVPSYNLNSKIHKQGNDYLGYVITCDDVRIYVAGDTDFIPEMKELTNITVAIIPIGEGKTAMDPQAAAQAVNYIKPGIAIPVHYELGKGKEKRFAENVDKNIKVVYFQPELLKSALY